MKKVTVILLALWLWGNNAFAQQWRAVGGGVDAPTLDLATDEARGLLYVSGMFKHAGDSTVAELATWDGEHWAKVGNYADPQPTPGIDAQIFSVVPHGNEVFLAGGFNGQNTVYLGSQMAYRYDGAVWDTCGNPDGPLRFGVVNGELFALGDFRRISWQLASGLAKWDGASWVPFGDTLPGFRGNGSFTALEYYQGNYYLGGNYDFETRFKEIVYWDGHRWNSPGNGIPGQSWVDRLKVYNGLLYVGGYFHEAEGNADDMLMTWNGGQWKPSFDNVHFDSQIYDMEVIDGKLYFAAWHHVWNGSSWQGPYGIGRYDGAQFCSFGGIISNTVISDVAGLKGEIYVNISNPIFGNDTVNYIAQWVGGDSMAICVDIPTAVAEPVVEGVRLFPNPCGGSFSLDLPPSLVGCSIRVFDGAGREMVAPTRYYSGEFDVSGLAAGLYFVELVGKAGRHVVKLVKE